MKFENPEPITRGEFAAALASGESAAICSGLVATALHEEDWAYVQNLCLALLTHADKSIRAVACTCLGHVARIHRRLDRPVVEAALRNLRLDASVGGNAQDALDDIGVFMGSAKPQ